MRTALIIDDDRSIVTTLEICLEELGFSVNSASTAAKGLELLKAHHSEIVFLDLKLPDQNGLDILSEMVVSEPLSSIIIITAYATIDTAVKAVKMGAFDYLPKPFTPAQITRVIEMIKRVNKLESQIRTLKGITQEGGLLTRSRRMTKILKTARQIADSTATVLITGESGTGKGLLARLIHDWSHRASAPFVMVDCAGLHESLLESDLFGHRKGAFTGAIQDKEGKLKTADSGTVFLDEVSEMTPSIQAKLLRFLQSREFERLGDTASIKVDVRIVGATNKSLEDLITEGRFRQDLYFRMNVVELNLPPLRERPEDIRILAEFYLKRFALLNEKIVSGFSDDTLERLESYKWPGNIRELVNVIERGTILCQGKQLTLRELPPHITDLNQLSGTRENFKSLSEIEKNHIQFVLTHTDSIDEASKVLGIDPATLWRKRKKYNID
ncbi:MAG: sigma-54 dependent transcriptional regulator [Desulfobacteraceae bacterium]|jgi:NtrC-family two-component system response regulator AlgB|nr:sigma-54 dependent transcriptional regulator [Desulfobacteraceae bacterium]